MTNTRRKRNSNLAYKISFVLLIMLACGISVGVHMMKDGAGEKVVGETKNNEISDIEKKYINDEENADTLIEKYAAANGYNISDYPKSIIKMLKKNKETMNFVLEYPEKKNKKFKIDLSKYKKSNKVPLFMQWDQRWGYHTYAGDCIGVTGCGPTCLSMVAVYILGDTTMNPKWMADFSQQNGYSDDENGSAWALISEGGRSLGMNVLEIGLDEERIIANLEVGNPIICTMGPGDFTTSGHFIIMTGYEDGKIIINDPNSKKNSQKRWKYDLIKNQIKCLWLFVKSN